jgi:hypothetical protein
VGPDLNENGASLYGRDPIKGSPKQLRGRSLGTKLSEVEHAVAAATEKSASRRGQTLSEWCRQALLEAVAGPAPRPEAEVILSEILALRKIVINLLYGDKAGEPLSEEHIPGHCPGVVIQRSGSLRMSKSRSW